MARSAKNAPKESRVGKLSPSEAYNLAPAQEAAHRANDAVARANSMLASIASDALAREGITDADLTQWGFDIRDDGPVLVERGQG